MDVFSQSDGEQHQQNGLRSRTVNLVYAVLRKNLLGKINMPNGHKMGAVQARYER
jgi:hypothetical protein